MHYREDIYPIPSNLGNDCDHLEKVCFKPFINNQPFMLILGVRNLWQRSSSVLFTPDNFDA